MVSATKQDKHLTDFNRLICSDLEDRSVTDNNYRLKILSLSLTKVVDFKRSKPVRCQFLILWHLLTKLFSTTV